MMQLLLYQLLTSTQALARAVYARTELIILDDVLSGLDATTENQVFHNLLGENGLLQHNGSTIVLASSDGTLVVFASTQCEIVCT
jgi:ABC-type dipeptide/oligopeptide/nickel transport system ATPase subunit